MRRGVVCRTPGRQFIELVRARGTIEVRRPEVRDLEAVAPRETLGGGDFQMVVFLLAARIAPVLQAVAGSHVRVRPQQLVLGDVVVGEKSLRVHVGEDEWMTGG